jgi:hypothetical protein
MEDPEISTHKELLLHIKYLKVEKLRQEEDLKRSVKALFHAFHPVTFVKDSLHQLVADKEVHMDLVKLALNWLATYILDYFGKKEQSASEE